MPEPPVPAGAEPEALAEALSWRGFKLDDRRGRRVGRVDGVLVDSRDGTPTWLLVRIGVRGRHVAVPFDFVAGAAGHAWAACTREAIRDAPETPPDAGIACASEIELCSHYGVPPGVRRRGALDARPGEELSSVQPG